MENINISADFGEHYIAEVTYVDGGVTMHGPFDTEQEAADWLDARAELDYKDFVGEGRVLVLNRVKPKENLRTSKCHYCDEVHPVGRIMYEHSIAHHMDEIKAMGAKLGTPVWR